LKHLYIHFPFCASRCDYCDFYSTAGSLGSAAAYVEAVLAELEAESAKLEAESAGFESLDTVYLGGGTPTLLGGSLLSDVIEAARAYCGPGAEISVEANPSTVNRELAETLAEAGVNRVSLGAQSFDQVLRRNLGRRGDAASIGTAVAVFREAGLKNIGLDLMFGIPGQDRAALDADLKNALALGPDHISCYELTVKEDSSFQQRWREELEAAAGQGREFYEAVVDTLEGAGFKWYETSNFARPGYECRHNLGYWRGEDFIGLGAGAWSSVGPTRWRNVEDIGIYLEPASGGDWRAIREYEELSPEMRVSERLMLGLRCDEGVVRSEVAGAIDDEQEKFLLRNGFLIIEGGRISLTRRGRFVANEVCARLLRD